MHETCCVPDPAKNVWAEQLQLCKDKICTTDEPIPKLYEAAQESLKDNGYDLVCDVPPLDDVKAGLYRKRNKCLGVRKVAYFKDVGEIVIPKKFEDFVLADYYDTDERIIIFCSKKAMTLMEGLKHFFGDGTFTACVPPFTQIYTIHGDCGSGSKTTNISPLVYALMNRRSTLSYQILFQMIKSRIPGWNPQKYTCDFEKSAMKGIATVFPTVSVKGCYYHFQESLKRKAKQLQLFKDKNNRRCVFLCRSLALLPKYKIIDGWQYVQSQFAKFEHLQPFLKYFKNQWMKSNLIEEWCVFGERHRTNNFVEGWHGKLNKSIKRYNKNILDVIAAFKKDSCTKRQPNLRKSSSQINDKIIQDAQMELLYGDISVGHFLEMLR